MPQTHLSDLMELSDKIDVPMFIVEVRDDDDLIFRKLNRFHEATTGMSSAAIAGKRPHDILPPRVADGITAKYMRCVRSKKALSYEEVLDLPKGELWWETRLSPIIFKDGRVIGIVGTALEITARKTREFKDAEVIAQLRELNEEVNMYTSMAAHDVRGPLRKIQVMSELIGEGHEPGSDAPLVLDADQVALLENIGAVAAKSLQHVDSILSYSRALSLEAETPLETVNLSMLCVDLMGVIDPQSTLGFEHPTDTIVVERIVLQVVLRNLLENAARHCKARCHVSLGVDDERSDRLKMVVSDDGAGFEDTTVFAHRNAGSSLKTATRGFGLDGAQRMIEGRGCDIWLAAPYFGCGASVAFTLPGTLAPAR